MEKIIVKKNLNPRQRYPGTFLSIKCRLRKQENHLAHILDLLASIFTLEKKQFLNITLLNISYCFQYFIN